MQVPDWLLVEVAMLFIGLTKISLTKSGFYHLFVIESPLRLRALAEKIKKSNTRVTPPFWVRVHNTKTTLPMFRAAHSSSLVWWPLPNVSHSTHLIQ
jgi:hypothetical protein